MQSTAVTTRFLTAADVSSILNLICPGCGSPLGGFAEEFKCQGYCRTDWRTAWASSGPRSAHRHTISPLVPPASSRRKHTKRKNAQHPF
jgi:hypothetical protein